MRIAPALFALALFAFGTPVCAKVCSHHLFVSGYFSNNVAIFDGCSGSFLRQLEVAGRIRGAQAVRYNDADDLIYVVSEGNDQIQRYRRNADYTFVDIFAQLESSADPTGVAFGPAHEVYVAGYGTNSVVELDPVSGAQVGVLLPPDSGLLGADNGMMVAASGLVYVPGYDSSSVAMIDPGTGAVQAQFIAPGADGLFNTRGIVDEGTSILVGGEGSGAVYRFHAGSGVLMQTLISGLVRPTGLAIAPDGSLLVLAGSRVRRYDRSSGASLGIFANPLDGGVSGGTFLALVPNPAADPLFRDGFEDAPVSPTRAITD